MPAPKHPVLTGSTSILEEKAFIFYLNSSSILYSLIYVISNESVLSFSNIRASDGCFSTLVVRTHSEISTLGGCSWWVGLRCFTMFAHVTVPRGWKCSICGNLKNLQHTHTRAHTHAHTRMHNTHTTHTRAHTHAHNMHTHTTHTHTHTHTHVGFYGLWGLSIGVMVFILYKLYVLLPYTYPTPKLSPHRRRCISTFPPKNLLCMIYKHFELWGHWKCPHKSPSPCNTYVIPMSLYKFVSS